MGEADSSLAWTPEMVATNFVEQYYGVLFSRPDIIHKFYEDSSKLTRPNLDGVMSSASTMQGIKDKMLSLVYNCCKAEIESIDAQLSCNDAILVLVTGFLIGESEKKRSFTQTFFLAKHEVGYFVLNDIFRFGIVADKTVAPVATDKVAEEDITTPLAEENKESAQVSHQQAEVDQSESVENVSSNGPTNPLPCMKDSADKEGLALEQVVVSEQGTSSQKEVQEQPKMSYALMLAKQSPVSSPVKRSITCTVVVAPSANSYLDKKSPTTPEKKMPAPPRRKNAPLTSDNSSDGKSIYIGNLPPHIPAEELDKSFSKYGTIQKDGIQVRTYADGFSYGFLEFESTEAARKAIEAHTFWFGNYKSYVTEKRSSTRVNKNNGNVRPSSANSEFHINGSNPRSRENSTEGRRDGGQYQNRNRSDRGHTNINQNGSLQKPRSIVFSGRSNDAGEQKQGAKPAPTTSVK